MKAFIPTILLMLLTTFGVQAQTASTGTNTNPFPTIATLTSWASYNSQSKFDIEVRGIGFKFEVKSVEEGSTAFTYIRKVTANDISYTDRIVYRIANGNTASIKYYIISNCFDRFSVIVHSTIVYLQKQQL